MEMCHHVKHNLIITSPAAAAASSPPLQGPSSCWARSPASSSRSPAPPPSAPCSPSSCRPARCSVPRPGAAGTGYQSHHTPHLLQVHVEEHQQQHQPQRPGVGPLAEVPPLPLHLRSVVLRPAHPIVRFLLSDYGVQLTNQFPVTNIPVSLVLHATNQHIAWLDVPVNRILLMQVADRAHDIEGNLEAVGVAAGDGVEVSLCVLVDETEVQSLLVELLDHEGQRPPEVGVAEVSDLLVGVHDAVEVGGGDGGDGLHGELLALDDDLVEAAAEAALLDELDVVDVAGVDEEEPVFLDELVDLAVEGVLEVVLGGLLGGGGVLADGGLGVEVGGGEHVDDERALDGEVGLPELDGGLLGVGLVGVLLHLLDHHPLLLEEVDLLLLLLLVLVELELLARLEERLVEQDLLLDHVVLQGADHLQGAASRDETRKGHQKSGLPQGAGEVLLLVCDLVEEGTELAEVVVDEDELELVGVLKLEPPGEQLVGLAQAGVVVLVEPALHLADLVVRDGVVVLRRLLQLQLPPLHLQGLVDLRLGVLVGVAVAHHLRAQSQHYRLVDGLPDHAHRLEQAVDGAHDVAPEGAAHLADAQVVGHLLELERVDLDLHDVLGHEHQLEEGLAHLLEHRRVLPEARQAVHGVHELLRHLVEGREVAAVVDVPHHLLEQLVLRVQPRHDQQQQLVQRDRVLRLAPVRLDQLLVADQVARVLREVVRDPRVLPLPVLLDRLLLLLLQNRLHDHPRVQLNPPVVQLHRQARHQEVVRLPLVLLLLESPRRVLVREDLAQPVRAQRVRIQVESLVILLVRLFQLRLLLQVPPLRVAAQPALPVVLLRQPADRPHVEQAIQFDVLYMLIHYIKYLYACNQSTPSCLPLPSSSWSSQHTSYKMYEISS